MCNRYKDQLKEERAKHEQNMRARKKLERENDALKEELERLRGEVNDRRTKEKVHTTYKRDTFT